MIKHKSLCIIVLLNLLDLPICMADVAVIVHPKNIAAISPAMIRNIFLGKIKVFDNGLPIFAIAIEPGDAARDEFQSKVLRKSDDDLNAYWTRQLYFSEGAPPEEVENSTSVINVVANNQFAIGYVDIKAVNDSVKILAIIH